MFVTKFVSGSGVFLCVVLGVLVSPETYTWCCLFVTKSETLVDIRFCFGVLIVASGVNVLLRKSSFDAFNEFDCSVETDVLPCFNFGEDVTTYS